MNSGGEDGGNYGSPGNDLTVLEPGVNCVWRIPEHMEFPRLETGLRGSARIRMNPVGVHDKNIPLGGEGGVAGLPEGVQAVSGVEAAQSHDGSGSFLSPEHARLFAADADHAAASRLNDS